MNWIARNQNERAKPRLVIFDDAAYELREYCEEFAKRGFETIGVLSLSPERAARLLDENGHLDPLKIDQLAAERAAKPTSPTLDAAAASGFEDMKTFRYAVVNDDDVRRMLAELAPDAVLSDRDMNPSITQCDGYEVFGYGGQGYTVMKIAREVMPDAPRILHSGGFHSSIERTAQAAAEREGYWMTPKGNRHAPYLMDAIAERFEGQLAARGR